MKRNRKNPDGAGTRKHTTPVMARKIQQKNIIVDLYTKGHSIRSIIGLAEEATGGHRFGHGTIAKYINEAVNEWKAAKADLILNHKAIELEKINRLEGTYWDAWERSCQAQLTTTKIKTKGEETGTRLALSQEKAAIKEVVGDPRFLQGIQWCSEMRCKILGIEVPQTALQMNSVTNNTQVNNTTVINRKVVFLKRETTIQQTVQTPK